MSAKTDFAVQLTEMLWDDFKKRVPHAQAYQDFLNELHGNLVIDHVAFRSLAVTAPDGTYLGLTNVKRVFDALNFEGKGAMEFPAQRLFVRYSQHAIPSFPKIFLSELKVDELPTETARAIREAVADYIQLLTESDITAIAELKDNDSVSNELLQKTFLFFRTVPWSTLPEHTIDDVNRFSQYGAWVLLHGYNANHFAAFINGHGLQELDEIEALVTELKKRGMPMQEAIEGEPLSPLRQTSSEVVRVPVTVKNDDGIDKQIMWTYGYMEFAERNEVETPDGRRELFQGFLGPQARQLFEMTKLVH